MVSLTRELKQFLEPFDPEIVEVASALRSRMLAAAPTAYELVYDAHNAVAMGYSFTGRPSDAFCHIAVYSRWVNLGFNRGSELPDPKGLLVGAGRLVRHIRIESVVDVKRPHVREFVRAAIARARRPVDGKTVPGPRSIVRAVYPKKRRPKCLG